MPHLALIHYSQLLSAREAITCVSECVAGARNTYCGWDQQSSSSIPRRAPVLLPRWGVCPHLKDSFVTSGQHSPTVNCKSMYSKWCLDEPWKFFQTSPFCKMGYKTCGAFSSRHHFHLVNRQASEEDICKGWYKLMDNSFIGRPPWSLAKLWIAKPLHTFSLARRDIGVTLHVLNARFLARVTCFYNVHFTFLFTFVVRNPYI